MPITTIREMNTTNQTAYKKIPVIIKKNKDGEITKTLYPVYYNLLKETHQETYKNVMNKIFYKAFTKKFECNNDKLQIAKHIYDTYYNEYKFDIDDVKITQEIGMFGEPYTYMCEINNDRWNVSYYITIAKYGEQLKSMMTEYVRENIAYFTPHTIWIHLQDYKMPTQEREASNFEDTDTKCPICLEDYCEDKECDKLHNCGHKYCVDCIEQVIDYGSCSICRETTEIDEEAYPLTKEDIENYCEDGDCETLINLLEDAGEMENFISYCADSDGYTHILGYESGTDFTTDDGTEYILMCRLDAYEKKTNNTPYTIN